MPDPTDPNAPPPSGAAPTAGTMYAAAGGAVAVIAVGIAKSFGHDLDAPTAAAIATLVTLGVSYLHPDGRQFK